MNVPEWSKTQPPSSPEVISHVISVSPGKGVTVVGVHPAVAFTNLRDKMLTRGRWMKPFLRLTMKTPVQSAQTTIFAALDPGLISGQLYRLDFLQSCYIHSVTLTVAGSDGELVAIRQREIFYS